MIDTTRIEIEQLLQKQRMYFNAGKTKDIQFRLESLKKLYAAILKYEKRITDSLWEDLHKSKEESYLTEISIVLQEIRYHIRHLKGWAKNDRVRTPLKLFPSKSEIVKEPLGVSLIIAPWNYPFYILMNPLVGSISAGCCTILKPSPSTPNVASVMEEFIRETFEDNFIGVVQGGREVNKILLEQKFDLIFFTGSSAVGKVVMKAAAEHLTPVILELGGKSPCIVEKDANLDIAAKRIVWGKSINAGQTCIAPDYLFVHENVKEELLEKMKQALEEMFGQDAQQSNFYARIVNEEAFSRLTDLLNEGKVRYGGIVNGSQKYISPTIIDEVRPEFKMMKEEIFGPLLPVMTFSNVEEAISYINAREKPLAFYYFGSNKNAKLILSKISSGGACVNDVLLHIANHHLPFGGVGNSGFGKYHGKESFLAFSNRRSVITSSTRVDFPFKYVPFKYFKFLKKVV